MDMPDHNVLINAIRPDAHFHRIAKTYLEECLNGSQPIRLFPTVETSFLRVVTHPKIYASPTPFEEAWDFLRVLCSSPLVEICPWTQTARSRWGGLCASLGLTGNDCNDAMLAAVALDRGIRVVTFDHGFRRFPNLQLLILGK